MSNNKKIKVTIQLAEDNGGYSNYNEVGASEMVIMTPVAIKPALIALLANARVQMEDNYHYTDWINNDRN